MQDSATISLSSISTTKLEWKYQKDKKGNTKRYSKDMIYMLVWNSEFIYLFIYFYIILL